MDETIRVLHVDDEPDFVDLTATYLEREDDHFVVETATSASDAIGRLADDIDCLISDYDMPGMTGLELFANAREEYPNLPFILFTGKGSEEVASEAISAGVTDYLQKRGGSEQYTLLATRIRNAVEKTRALADQQRQVHAIETAREGIAFLNEDFEFIDVNDAYADLFGYDSTEMTGKAWRVFYPEDEIETVANDISPALQEDGYWRGETTFERADGETFVADHVISATESQQYVCHARDITDRKEQQREVERQNDLFAKAQDVADVGAWEYNPQEKETYFTEKVYEIYGVESDYEPEPETDIQKFYHPEDRDTVREAVQEALESGEPYDIEVRVTAADGTEKWVRTRCDPEFEDGTCQRARGTIQDITERKQRELELQAEREFIEQSLDTLDDIFYYVDTNGDFQRWNSTLPELTGYSDDEIESMNALEFFEGSHRETIRESIRRILETGSHVTEAEITTADGRQIPHEFRGVRMTDETGDPSGIIGIARDITERKQREQRLKRQNERLEEFASIVSHDLRNPLNVATSRLTLLKDECDNDQIEYIEQAHTRMERIIENVLWLAREGREISSLESVSVVEAIDDAWTMVTDGHETATLICPGEDELGRIEADYNGLRQLLENLFRNAIDHGGEDVTVRAGQLDGGGGFYIEDDGPGIPESDREAVFNAGYSTSETGTGFGLHIVKEVADAHEWDVRVTESTAGGARFEITGVEFIL